MSTEYELFKGKSLGGLFKDIYTNQLHKKQKISDLIEEVKNNVKSPGDMAVLGPILKDLIETSVKNDDQLVKLATIAQRIIASEKKKEGDDGFLTEKEKDQLLKDLKETQLTVQSTDDIDDAIDPLKSTT